MKCPCFHVLLFENVFAASIFLKIACGSNETIDNSHWIENIIPPNYVKIHQPTRDLWKNNIANLTTEVYFYFYPRHVLSVEPKTMDFTVDLLIELSWDDKRLNIPVGMARDQSVGTDIPKDVAMKLWTPSVYLTNCKACNDYLADPNDQRFKLYEQTIAIEITRTYKFTCGIDLRNYPFDAQQCTIKIEKWEEIIEVPFWKSSFSDIPTKDINVPPEFELKGIKWKNCTKADSRWTECSEFVFHFRRMIANHVMLVFIPSMLIVILSWVSFWLDVEVAAPRVALGLTSLLTLATQLNNSQRNLPPVSAIKAVDIWMFSCMFMVFSSLIEFAVANSWARRKKNAAKVEPVTTVQTILKSPLANIRRRNFAKQVIITKKKSRSSLLTKHSSPIDFIARIAFPVSYFIFNLIYWGYFATKDQ